MYSNILFSRDFGFGKRSMNELVQDEFKKFTLYIDNLLATGKPKKIYFKVNADEKVFILKDFMVL